MHVQVRAITVGRDLGACLVERQVDKVQQPMGMRTFQVRWEMVPVQLETMVDRPMNRAVDRLVDLILVITSQLLLL
jgi:hypothetical protein